MHTINRTTVRYKMAPHNCRDVKLHVTKYTVTLLGQYYQHLLVYQIGCLCSLHSEKGFVCEAETMDGISG